MRSSAVPRRLLTLALIALLAAAWGPPAAPTAGSPADAERAIVVVDDALLVDPATGEILWEAPARFSSALGPDGTLYLGVPQDGGTDVLKATPANPTPRKIGHTAHPLLVGGVSPAGDRLWLVSYAEGIPDEVRWWPLRTEVAEEDQRPRAYRDVVGGMLRSDGRRWYGAIALHFLYVEVRIEAPAGQPRASGPSAVIPLPDRLGGIPLMSPDGSRIYAANHWSDPQTITIVDTAAWEVERTVRLGRARTKAPACAAVLSPDGSRLYMAAREINTPDGIDVYDTDTFERVAHLFPGRSFYCLATSPDGDRLYASVWDFELVTLVTIDTATGEELNSVPIAGDPATPYLGLATSTG